MSTTTKRLDALCKQHPKFLEKGGLCVALIVTQTVQEKGLPLDPESLRTKEGGQVAGLGKASVQKILEAHGISKVLAKEGGRTSRGSLGLMKAYVVALNELANKKALNLEEAQAWWIEQVHAHFASEGQNLILIPANHCTQIFKTCSSRPIVCRKVQVALIMSAQCSNISSAQN